jgi:hypothetical protein
MRWLGEWMKPEERRGICAGSTPRFVCPASRIGCCSTARNILRSCPKVCEEPGCQNEGDLGGLLHACVNPSCPLYVDTGLKQVPAPLPCVPSVSSEALLITQALLGCRSRSHSVGQLHRHSSGRIRPLGQPGQLQKLLFAGRAPLSTLKPDGLRARLIAPSWRSGASR